MSDIRSLVAAAYDSVSQDQRSDPPGGGAAAAVAGATVPAIPAGFADMGSVEDDAGAGPPPYEETPTGEEPQGEVGESGARNRPGAKERARHEAQLAKQARDQFQAMAEQALAQAEGSAAVIAELRAERERLVGLLREAGIEEFTGPQAERLRELTDFRHEQLRRDAEAQGRAKALEVARGQAEVHKWVDFVSQTAEKYGLSPQALAGQMQQLGVKPSAESVTRLAAMLSQSLPARQAAANGAVGATVKSSARSAQPAAAEVGFRRTPGKPLYNDIARVYDDFVRERGGS